MYQQGDTTNLLGRRRWTSGLQGYVTSEVLARRMPVQSARAPAGWTGLGQTTATRSTSPTPVASPPYPAPPGLMWVWRGTPQVSTAITASIKPAGWTEPIYYAWHLAPAPGYGLTVLKDYLTTHNESTGAPIVPTPPAPVTVPPASLVPTPSAVPPAEVSAIDKVKAWLAEETIMPGYANQWFVVGAVAAYFLLRKK